MTFWFCIVFTWWLGHFISRYLKVHFMLIKYTCDSKSQTLRMRYPFQSTGRPISHRNGWSFRVYMIPLRDFVPEWNSRPGTTTGVNSRRGDSRRHDILWWYHINKCRAMWGNQSELTPARKSLQCYVNSHSYGVTQSRSQSPRYPCPEKRTTLDKGNAASGKQISRLFQINSTLQNVPGQ